MCDMRPTSVQTNMSQHASAWFEQCTLINDVLGGANSRYCLAASPTERALYSRINNLSDVHIILLCCQVSSERSVLFFCCLQFAIFLWVLQSEGWTNTKKHSEVLKWNPSQEDSVHRAKDRGELWIFVFQRPTYQNPGLFLLTVS